MLARSKSVIFTVVALLLPFVFLGAVELLLRFIGFGREYDLVFVRELAGKKYYPKKGIVEDLIPEVIRLDEVLSSLGIAREQLIDVAMLVGTDYNEGVKGIGPKTALKLIKRYGSIEEVVRARRIELGFDPEEVRRIFLNPEVSDQYELVWSEPEYAGIREFMLERDFSAERVDRGLERLRKAVERWRSESLTRWIS